MFVKKIASVISIFLLFFSTMAYSHFNDACINALDKSFRIHSTILGSSKDDENPLNQNGIKESFDWIKFGCNDQIYKMSIMSFAYIFYGHEINKDNSLQMCVLDIYSVYSIFMFNDERTAILNNELGEDIKKELITKFEKSAYCSLQTKNKILEKIGVIGS